MCALAWAKLGPPLMPASDLTIYNKLDNNYAAYSDELRLSLEYRESVAGLSVCKARTVL